jgi:uncharacterized protein YgiM (DUF1202 family)
MKFFFIVLCLSFSSFAIANEISYAVQFKVLNIREWCGMEYEVIGKLTQGQKIKGEPQQDKQWVVINHNGIYACVHQSGLLESKDETITRFRILDDLLLYFRLLCVV